MHIRTIQWIFLPLFFLLVNVTISTASEMKTDVVNTEVSDEVFVEESEKTFFINDATVARGVTLSAFENRIIVGIPPKAFNRSVHITLKLDSVDAETLPKNRRNGRVNFQISLQEEDAELSKAVTLVFPVSDFTYTPVIARWDEARSRWRDQPTTLRWKDEEVATTTKSLRAVYALQQDTAHHLLSVASWYPDRLAKDTLLGAASNEYPLGSYLTITNNETGKSVVVRVISRGPYVKNRYIDLTYSSFARIGYPRKQGILNVRIQPTVSPSVVPTTAAVKPTALSKTTVSKP